jgi:hypothetical protein
MANATVRQYFVAAGTLFDGRYGMECEPSAMALDA